MNEKKKMKGLQKRILSFVLTFAMVFILMPWMSTQVNAATVVPGKENLTKANVAADNLYYDYDNGLLISYSGYSLTEYMAEVGGSNFQTFEEFIVFLYNSPFSAYMNYSSDDNGFGWTFVSDMKIGAEVAVSGDTIVSITCYTEQGKLSFIPQEKIASQNFSLVYNGNDSYTLTMPAEAGEGYAWAFYAMNDSSCTSVGGKENVFNAFADMLNYVVGPHKTFGPKEACAAYGGDVFLTKSYTFTSPGLVVLAVGKTSLDGYKTFTFGSTKNVPTEVGFAVGDEATGDGTPFIEHTGAGSCPTTPSKSEAAAAPTIPTDYVAERVAEEEVMEVTVVTIDTTQYSKNEETVVPGTSYNLSKFITTKGIVKGIKTAVAAANNDKKDTVEIYTGKPFCFNKEIIKTIQESKKTVVYYFQYKGHIYSVTVPATVDASKVLEKAGFAGPLYVGKVLGTTKLVK